MRALGLLLVLASCATARGGGAYRQGAPMAPRAPSFEPSLDAPHTVGQPGYATPEPRQPPAPREPGVYAGASDPRTDLLYPPARGELEGVPPAAVARCALPTKLILGREVEWAKKQAMGALTTPELRCLFGRELADCLGVLRIQAELSPSAAWAAGWEHGAAKEAIDRYRAGVCWGLKLDAEPPTRVQALLQAASRWRREVY